MRTIGKIIDVHIMASNVPLDTVRDFKIKCLNDGVLMRDKITDLITWAMSAPSKKLGPLMSRINSIEKKKGGKYGTWYIQNLPASLKHSFKLWCVDKQIPMSKVVTALAQLHLEGAI